MNDPTLTPTRIPPKHLPRTKATPMRAILRVTRACAPPPAIPFHLCPPRPGTEWACSSDNTLPPRVPWRLVRAPLPGPSPRTLAITYLGHFGNSLLPGRGRGRHGCSRRRRANPGPQIPTLRDRRRPKALRQQAGFGAGSGTGLVDL